MNKYSEDKTLQGIIAFDKDIVVRAGAGAGKTSALVSKYLDELQKKRDGTYTRVEQLVALTFTEKSAAEMKERVRDGLAILIENLRQQIEEHEDPGLLGSSANLPEEPFDEMSDKKKLALSLIQKRQALEGAYISTIHSFCARILRENPMSAGVDPAFTVMGEEDAASLLDSVAHNVIMERLSAGDPGVATLIRDERFEDGGARYPGLKGHITRLIPLIRAASHAPMRMLTEYNASLKQGDKDSKAALKELESVVPQLETGKKSSKERSTLEKLEAMPNLFTSKPIAPSDAAMLLNLSKELESAVKKRKTGTDEEKATALEAAVLMRRVGAQALENAIAPNTRALLHILDSVLKEYASEKDKRSVLDYDDLEEKVVNLLRRHRNVKEVYTARFVRVLVDEFQDINNLQREIIYLLAKPGDGRLFVVGDFKQSIYGFRGAEVAVFEQVAKAINLHSGKQFARQVNRRSTPVLIEFTNGFFKSLMGDGEGSFRFDPSIDALEAMRDGIGVTSTVERITYGTVNAKIEELRMIEAVCLAVKIRNEVESGAFKVEDDNGVRSMGFGDIAILLRTFSSLNVYENAFRRAYVPFNVVRGRGFYQSPEIMDFVNLLSFLDHSADRLGLISILRSPFAGVGDAALLTLCRHSDGARADDPAPFILGEIPLPKKGLPKDDADKIRTFRKRILEWRANKDRMTISELLETILATSGYGAVMMSRDQGEQKLANLFKLIELARSYETDGAHGLKNFVTLLKKHTEQAPREALADVTCGDDKNVKIMTVHQSKGLEFPVVILADLGAEENVKTDSIAFHPRIGIGLKYHDPATGDKTGGLMFGDVKRAWDIAETGELKRLLYVAMTRARDRLILSGGRTGASKGKWSKWIETTLDEGGPEIERLHFDSAPENLEREAEESAPAIVDKILKRQKPEPATYEGKTKEHHTPDFIIPVTSLATFRHCPRMYYYQSVMELPLIGPLFSKKEGKERSAVKLGVLVHALLEKTPMGKDAPQNSMANAVADELCDHPEKLRKEVARNIKRAFGVKPLCDLATIESESVMREMPILCRILTKDLRMSITGAADLLWLDGKTLRLVDYKYSVKPDDELRYVFQLKLYAYSLMTAMEQADGVEASIIYLKERRNPVSAMSFIKSDMTAIRKQIVDAARYLKKLSGKQENEWPVKDRKFCDDNRCVFRGRCFRLN